MKYVLQKLSQIDQIKEVELKQHSVKLENIQQLEKDINESLKLYKDYTTLYGSIQTQCSKASSQARTLLTKLDAVHKSVAFFEAKAQELGLNPKEVPAIKKYWSDMPEVDENAIEASQDALDGILSSM